jgi:hypothetical protein
MIDETLPTRFARILSEPVGFCFWQIFSSWRKKNQKKVATDRHYCKQFGFKQEVGGTKGPKKKPFGNNKQNGR